MEQKPTIYKTEKWIIIEGGDKKVKFRRNSKRGVLIESTMNNPEGVKEELLELAMNRKEPVPLLNEMEQQEKIKEWGRDEIRKMATLQSRALTVLSNGKIYIEFGENGMRMVVPDDMQAGGYEIRRGKSGEHRQHR